MTAKTKKKKKTEKQVVSRTPLDEFSEGKYSMESMVKFLNSLLPIDTNLMNNLFGIICICHPSFLECNMMRKACLNNALLCRKKVSFLDIINGYFHINPEEKRSIIANFYQGSIKSFSISK